MSVRHGGITEDQGTSGRNPLYSRRITGGRHTAALAELLPSPAEWSAKTSITGKLHWNSQKEIRMSSDAPSRKAVILGPNEGRAYAMGRIGAVFKADGGETESRYSISEWWLEPDTQGPGAHSHPEDDVFYVIEGTMSLLVGEGWTDAAKGSFVLVPGGITHDFENRSNARAGVLNFSFPGNFEQDMTGIVQWFKENPPKSTGN